MTHQQRSNDGILDRVSHPEMTVLDWIHAKYGDGLPVPDQAGTEPDWRLEALEESMRLERPGGLP
jgi:hypothetical protein